MSDRLEELRRRARFSCRLNETLADKVETWAVGEIERLRKVKIEVSHPLIVKTEITKQELEDLRRSMVAQYGAILDNPAAMEIEVTEIERLRAENERLRAAVTLIWDEVSDGFSVCNLGPLEVGSIYKAPTGAWRIPAGPFIFREEFHATEYEAKAALEAAVAHALGIAC